MSQLDANENCNKKQTEAKLKTMLSILNGCRGNSILSSFEVIVTVSMTSILKTRRYGHKLFGIVDCDIHHIQRPIRSRTICDSLWTSSVGPVAGRLAKACTDFCTWGSKSAPAWGSDRSESSSTELILIVNKTRERVAYVRSKCSWYRWRHSGSLIWEYQQVYWS